MLDDVEWRWKQLSSAMKVVVMWWLIIVSNTSRVKVISDPSAHTALSSPFRSNDILTSSSTSSCSMRCRDIPGWETAMIGVFPRSVMLAAGVCKVREEASGQQTEVRLINRQSLLQRRRPSCRLGWNADRSFDLPFTPNVSIICLVVNLP